MNTSQPSKRYPSTDGGPSVSAVNDTSHAAEGYQSRSLTGKGTEREAWVVKQAKAGGLEE